MATIVFDDAAGLAGPGGGPIVLGSLTANVPATAVDAYASKDLLTLSVNSISGEDLLGNPLVPGVNALGSQAVHVVAFLGDATGDGTLDSSDVGLMEDVLGDVTAGFNAYKLADPAIIGDIAGRRVCELGRRQRSDQLRQRRLRQQRAHGRVSAALPDRSGDHSLHRPRPDREPPVGVAGGGRRQPDGAGETSTTRCRRPTTA